MKTNIHTLKRKTFTTRPRRIIRIDDEIETFKIGSRVKNNRLAKYAIVLRLTNYMKNLSPNGATVPHLTSRRNLTILTHL